jgi:uncharacterized DUF497 family protein
MGHLVISADGRFEWDATKSAANKLKHGIEFRNAVKVFDDPFIYEKVDWEHSTLEEERLKSTGLVEDRVVLVVCHTDRNGRIRVYSAREAAPEEKNDYVANYVSQVLGGR